MPRTITTRHVSSEVARFKNQETTALECADILFDRFATGVDSTAGRLVHSDIRKELEAGHDETVTTDKIFAMFGRAGAIVRT